MISSENHFKVISIIGLGAVSGTVFALGCNIKNWKWISISASIGCIIGASYIDLGRPFIHRIIYK